MRKAQQMKSLQEEIERIDAEIERLKVRRTAFVDAIALSSGAPSPPFVSEPVRKRAANIKPLVLQIMWQAGSAGATSGEVAEKVRETAPTVSKDSVGSILSRLKSEGALVHDGERYYDQRCAPPPKGAHPFGETASRVVN